MKTTKLFFAVALLVSVATQAQVADTSRADTSYWQESFSGGINFNQASFSDNWAGGGINSLALGGIIGARALYQKEKWSWDNTGDFQLGFVRQGGQQRKSADQLFINSVAGYKIAPKWDLFMSGTFNSFFAPGYKYGARSDGADLLVSKFLSPAFLTFAWGLAYKPNDWFSLRLAPFAPRFTFVTDDAVRVRETAPGVFVQDISQVAYGVQPGKKVRQEWLAFQLQAELNKNLTENINLKARYQMFVNYETFDPDHRLDLIVSAKINKYLNTTFGLTSIYDSDISGEIQLQQVLAIGLLYNVTTFKDVKK